MTTDVGARSRSDLVDAACIRWAKELVDTGKRNPLLYYRDLKAGTLNLEGANEVALAAFVAGSTVKLSTLFPTPDGLADALRRVRTIRKKVVTLEEERGIQTGYLATGFASWTEPDAHGVKGPAPAAPILLREIAITPRSASEDDFDLLLAEEADYNPVLIHHLSTQFGGTVDLSSLPEDPDEKSWSGIAEALAALEAACSQVPGFLTTTKQAIGSFSYQKLPLVRDLQSDLELLASSNIIAALAGYVDAQSFLRARSGEGDSAASPDRTPPHDEFLVLDADSSQNYAINTALSGNHLVIKGPPGTGKSQTIANMIASLIARGKKVLFVAEKRAAIDAVLGRLRSADLDTWVMDLHDGLANRRQVAQQLADTFDRAAGTQAPDVAALHRLLLNERLRLIKHEEMMHTPRKPWGLSAYEVQARRLALGGPGVTFRFRGPALMKATQAIVESAAAAITEFADLDGLAAAEAGAWSGSRVVTPDQAHEAIALVRQLRDRTVPTAGYSLRALIGELGLVQPTSVNQWQSALELVTQVADLREHLVAEVFDADLEVLVAATATRRWRIERKSALTWGGRRRALKVARSLSRSPKPAKSDLHTWLVRAAELSARWRSASVDGRHPRTATDLDGALTRFKELRSELGGLGVFLVTSDLGALDLETALPQKLDALVSDQSLLNRLPRLRELERQISNYQLDDFVAECRANGTQPDEVRPMLQAAWLDSILDELALADPLYGAFQGATLTRAVESYQEADRQHIRSTAARVQRSAAEALYLALDAHPDQTLLVRKQASLKRRHASMRELLAQAGDVLLAAKPCWAMSPLVVSQVLPLKRMFDVVIFDEASQVPPADAIPSIARGTQLVVAGDERQLPPTAFFSSNLDDIDDEDGDTEHITLTSGFESILDALTPLISTRNLQWHYRSRDERLIAFSNAHIYDSSLTTFPGAHHDDVLRHVNVPQDIGPIGVSGSPTAEVAQVVDLVIKHAETRPNESLGVIAMGIKHADRIDAAVRERLRGRADLEGFFSESNDERFFVKNLERVQGDERDAIIMSVGYGKSADGRMLYRFGPINNEGGERRLNVAVSRAKRRMTLVSSFGSADLDPARLNARGAQLFGAYVAFMESGGTDLGSFATAPPALNAFEQDIRDRLSAAGLRLQAQFGVSGYRIDFVAAHPVNPGQFVLAIEADGASYHSSATARDRDRLRQEHLERLGWRFHRIWSTDWFRDPMSEVEKVLASFRDAVLVADRGEPADGRMQRADPEPPLQADVRTPVRALPRPWIDYGEPITVYSQSDLVNVIQWIESDGLLRTEADLIRAAMDALGWRRRGSRIDTGLREAIAIARRSSPRP